MNQSNLVHQHVYYSNRFEPGKLFPEIISNSFNNNLYGDQSLRALITYGFVAPETLSAGGDSFTVTSLGEYALTTSSRSLFQHVPLYYTAPTDDFNLRNNYVGVIVFSGTDIESYELTSSLTSSIVKNFTTTNVLNVTPEYAPALGAVSVLSVADVNTSPVSLTTISMDIVVGSVVFNAVIQ